MSEHDPGRSAYDALQSGNFSDASDYYGLLLEQEPDEIEYRSGFYAAGWWLNRFHHIREHRPGRNLGSWLMQEWEAFTVPAGERGFLNTLSYQAAMRGVLGMAADQLRIAYQEEGGAVGAEVLLDLGRCLIRIQDYRNAVEILNYARRVRRNDPVTLFLLGESLLSLSEEENFARGTGYYRDAMLIDPDAIDPTLIASPSITALFQKIHGEDGELANTLLWLPAWLITITFLPGVPPLAREDILALADESQRLSRDLYSVVPKFREKVRARLSFYLMILIHQAVQIDHDSSQATPWEEMLERVAPELFAEYKKRRRESRPSKDSG